MSLKNRHTLIKSLTAVIGLVIVGAFLFLLPKYCFYALLVLIGWLGLREFRLITQSIDYPIYRFPVLLAFTLGLGTLFLATISLVWVTTAVIVLTCLRSIWTQQTDKIPYRAGFTLFAAAYLGQTLTATAYIFDLDHTNADGRILLTVFLLITWAGDISAFIAGNLFGKHKIPSPLSPNKSFEGLAGQLIGCLLVASAAKLMLVPTWWWLDVVILAIICWSLGFFGDLIESSWKRLVRIKDSGTILPGHGGILDRIDSLFLTAPIFYTYVVHVILTRP